MIAACAHGSVTTNTVLARLNISGAATGLSLQLYAQLRDSTGQEYVLAVADTKQLAGTGLRFQALDDNAIPEDYVLARKMRAGVSPSILGDFRVVHDDGVQQIIRATEEEVNRLAESGFAVARLPHEPICWKRAAVGMLIQSWPERTAQGIVYDPLVAEMIGRVQTSRLSTLMRRISGIEPDVTGGDLYTVATRRTDSGVPVQNATQLVFEHLQSLGLNVRFHAWSRGRNVEGTLPGGARSNEVVMIVAHLDNMPGGAVAPGADDNGSGTAGVLLAAEIYRQFQFERTIRFLLVTGEEQGLLGSAAYATDAANAGDNIVAVLNLDMISWDSNNDGVLDLYTRSTSALG